MPISCVTFDLWQTLLLDNRELGLARTEVRLEGALEALREAGEPFTKERVREAYRQCYRTCHPPVGPPLTRQRKCVTLDNAPSNLGQGRPAAAMPLDPTAESVPGSLGRTVAGRNSRKGNQVGSIRRSKRGLERLN